MDKLNLGQHISQQYNEELEEVRNKVLSMGGVVLVASGLSLGFMVQGVLGVPVAGSVPSPVSMEVSDVEVEPDGDSGPQALAIARVRSHGTPIGL